MEKKSDLKSITNQKSGNKRALEIYKQLLELSNGDLDQYVNEDELNIEKTPMEEYSDIFQEFLDLVSQLYVTHDSEVLIKKFEDVSENKKSKDFLRWLNEYALSLSHIVKETLFIRNMDIGHFSEMAKFCLDNFVLQNSGEFVEENDWNNKQLRILMNGSFNHRIKHHVLKHKIICFGAKTRILQRHIRILFYPEKFMILLPFLYDTCVIFSLQF